MLIFMLFLASPVLLLCVGWEKMISWIGSLNDNILNRNDGKDNVVNGHEVCVALVNIQGSLSGREDIVEANVSQLLCRFFSLLFFFLI